MPKDQIDKIAVNSPQELLDLLKNHPTGLGRPGKSPLVSMASVYRSGIAELIDSGVLSKQPGSTASKSALPLGRVFSAARFGKSIRRVNDEDGISLGLNCRNSLLAEHLNRDGLIEVAGTLLCITSEGYYAVDRKGQRRPHTAIGRDLVAAMRELGYPEPQSNDSRSVPLMSAIAAAGTYSLVWKRVDRRKSKGRRLTLNVSFYQRADNGMVDTILDLLAEAEVSYFYNSAVLWVNYWPNLITLGCAFSGPHTPSLYYLPNPFNHLHDPPNTVCKLYRAHFFDSTPGSQPPYSIYSLDSTATSYTASDWGKLIQINTRVAF